MLTLMTISISQDEMVVLPPEVVSDRLVQFDKHFWKLAEDWEKFQKEDFSELKAIAAKNQSDLEWIMRGGGIFILMWLGERAWFLFGGKRKKPKGD